MFQSHNTLFLAGQETFFVGVNSLTDLSFQEFTEQYLGLGPFSTLPSSISLTSSFTTPLTRIFLPLRGVTGL